MPLVTVLAVLSIFAWLMFGAMYAQKEALQSQVRTACQGVVADLDLTEWVAVCISTR